MPSKSPNHQPSPLIARDGSISTGCDVVIGASSGLGAALATYLRHQRWPLVIAARRLDRLQEIAAESAREIVCAQVDLTVTGQLDYLANVITRHGFVRRLFMVAAANEPEMPFFNDIPSHQSQVSDYVRLLFTGWVSLVEVLEKRGCIGPGSTVVGISSIAAGVPFRALPLYGGGKAALEQWMRAKRRSSVARYVVVRPGRFDSEFYSPNERSVGLPMGLAKTIVGRVEAGQDEISLGCAGDRIACAVQRSSRWLSRLTVKDASPVGGQE